MILFPLKLSYNTIRNCYKIIYTDPPAIQIKIETSWIKVAIILLLLWYTI